MPYLESLAQDVGRWQIALIIANSILAFNSAPSHLAVLFYAPEQDYWCSIPSNLTLQNESTTAKYMNENSCDIPISGGNYQSSENHNQTDIPEEYKCTSWEFSHDFWKRTIVEDYGLICDRDILISTSMFVYMFGVMAGVLLFGVLADRYGRKLMMNLGVSLWVTFTIMVAFSVNYEMFAVTRLLAGLSAAGSITIIYVWTMESLVSKGRAMVGILFSILWASGTLMITGVSYLTGNWFHTQIILSCIIASYFFSYWMTVESPRWLFSVGRFDDGMETLKKIAKMNKKLEPDEKLIRNEINSSKKGESKNSVNVLDIFRTPNLRKRTLILYLNWFSAGFVYFAITLNSGKLAGDFFVNMTIAACLESIGITITFILLVKIGRRLPTASGYIISGICCFILAFIPSNDWPSKWSKVGIALISRTATGVSFTNMYVYTPELYPTIIRAIGLGSGGLLSRIGSMIAPYAKELGKHTNESVPMILCGVLATSSGILTLFLPETKDKTLPNTIEEGENFGMDSSDKKKRFSWIKTSRNQESRC